MPRPLKRYSGNAWRARQLSSAILGRATTQQTAMKPPTLQSIQTDVIAWAAQQFPGQTLRGKLNHLRLGGDPMEAADCQILLLQIIGLMGISAQAHLENCVTKLAINKRRQWPAKPDADDVYAHLDGSSRGNEALTKTPKAEWQQQLVFTNEFKIRFCNGFAALWSHARLCEACETYLRHGDSDLCDAGKNHIKRAFVLSDVERSPLNPKPLTQNSR